MRLEQDLWATIALVTQGDDLPIWQLIDAFLVRRSSGDLQPLTPVLGRLELRGEVLCYEAVLLLDVAHDLPFGRRGQYVATLHQQPRQTIGEVPACQVDAPN